MAVPYDLPQKRQFEDEHAIDVSIKSGIELR